MNVYIAFMGMLQSLLPVWAELHGTKRPRQLGFSFRQSLYLMLAIMLLGMAVWMLSTRPLYQPYQLFKRLEKPHWPALAAFARIGIPSGLTILV